MARRYPTRNHTRIRGGKLSPSNPNSMAPEIIVVEESEEEVDVDDVEDSEWGSEMEEDEDDDEDEVVEVPMEPEEEEVVVEPKKKQAKKTEAVAKKKESEKKGKKREANGKDSGKKEPGSEKKELAEPDPSENWVWGPYTSDEESAEMHLEGEAMEENSEDSTEEEVVLPKKRLEEAKPPEDLIMNLLSFQKQWLAWALEQENGWTKGGILADEMGMGKTIQAISLILANRKKMEKQSHPAVRNGETKGKGKCCGQEENAHLIPSSATLVICPLVAPIQWKNEIAKFTKPGALQVAVYHGPKRTQNAHDLAGADVVLTTYSTVEVDYRRFEMPPKLPCKWCGKLFHPDRMWVHLKYFCGPDAQKTDAQAKQAKKKKTGFKGKGGAKEKGVKKRSSGRGRKRRNVQVHTEDPSAQEGPSVNGMEEENPDSYPDQNSNLPKMPKSLLHKIAWHRIILDEGHCIKDRKSSTAKSVFALTSTYRWALSGTPLQNRVQELYSLVRFLSLDPYSYYFCKKCDCQFLDYSFGPDHKKCDHCGHTPLQHFCWWNRKIANPIRNYGYQGKGREAMKLLRERVLPEILLRRTKEQCADDLALPPRTLLLRRDTFDEREHDFYEALYTQSQSQFDTYVRTGTLLNNYAHIFDLLIRLRQAVNHPYLVVHSQTALNAIPADGSLDAKRAQGEYGACAVCSEEAEDPVISSCNHMFCRSCAWSLLESCTNAGVMGCPTCDAPLSIDLNAETEARPMDTSISIGDGLLKNFFLRKNSILNRINLGGFQSSTKIEALREELHRMKQQDPSAKAIIFSQFTSMLEIIEYRLMCANTKCAKLLGSMTVDKREKMIDAFTNDPDCDCLLISLKAGGVALNLTVASYVMIMDPWWNPAVEQQAQDRIHRLGQYKPIKTIRFVIAGTIEERILKLQEKKQLVFQGTVGADTSCLARLTEDDLRFLFA